MNRNILERLEILRIQLKKKGLDACIVPTADPHQSEYTAECWKYREYLSGFTGSAGTLVVGLNDACLWTDSRYFLQAEEELKGSGIKLLKSGLPETPSPEEWICNRKMNHVGLDGSVFSCKSIATLTNFFKEKGTMLHTHFAPYAEVWTDRPVSPKGLIYPYPDFFSGESTQSKLVKLRSEMISLKVDGLPLTSLDEIAWLFNLRGEDVDFNPVGLCYAFVSMNQALIFVDKIKLSSETIKHLEENKIDIQQYDSLPTYLKGLSNGRLLIDLNQLNYELYTHISDSCSIMEANSPVSLMKAIKNPVELAGFRNAMIKDGWALTRFWMWMEKNLNTANEWDLGEKIAEFRNQQEHYVGESFAPIVAFNEHGAIVHYQANRDDASPITTEGFLLIDTGGQYLDGTTDLTRSWSFHSNPPIQYKSDYTCLLKGIIALTSARFPAGTRGAQLDVLARQFIWQKNLNFGHGTGHGVGHFLNVHEGPQSIRMNENPTCLEAGMVLSNEPGVYRTGQYGIRLENLMAVCEQETSDFGSFLGFETLTLLPFDRNSIETTLLSPFELNWINNYHQTIFDRLAPGLSEAECNWLKHKTRKID